MIRADEGVEPGPEGAPVAHQPEEDREGAERAAEHQDGEAEERPFVAERRETRRIVASTRMETGTSPIAPSKVSQKASTSGGIDCVSGRLITEPQA
jgi:hypothetical protein